MSLQKLFALIIVCSLLTVQNFAQPKSVSSAKADEISSDLKKDAVALLRDMNRDIAKLKTPENRQFFSIQVAGLLWDYDETQSRTMFQGAMNDVRQSLVQASADVAQNKSKSDEKSTVYAANTGAYENYYGLDSELRLRVQKTLRMRRALIYALAETDPQMADEFLQETTRTITNAKLTDTYSAGDNQLEVMIAVQYAKKDVGKATDKARSLLLKSFSSGLLDILNEIYKQNEDKGSQLAEEFVQKLKTSNPSKEQIYERNYFALRFLKMASVSLEETKTDARKKPLLSESSTRELANYLGQVAMNKLDLGYTSTSEIAAAIEKYAPEQAAQLRVKQKRESASVSSNTVRSMSNIAVASNSNVGTRSSEEAKKARERAQEFAEKQKQAKAERDAVTEKLKRKDLSEADKTFVIAQIKKFVSESGTRDDKIKNFVYWATQSAEADNSEIAETLMREAESLANPQTKTYRDYMSKWWLASGYSTNAPEKSFAILEEIVPPFNDIVSHFVKVGEFIDDRKEIVSEDEILIGEAFVGSIQLAGILPESGRVTRSLAKTNFSRTKSLTDKFERPELRLLAQLLVLRSLLKPLDETKIRATTEVSFDDY